MPKEEGTSVLSIQAYGFFRYISDGFNVFDGVIVIFSCLEIYNSFVYGLESGENSGISVLRTFRLLREDNVHVTMSSFLTKFDAGELLRMNWFWKTSFL